MGRVLIRPRLLGAVLVVLCATAGTAACSPDGEPEKAVELAPVFLTGTVMDDGKPVADVEVSVQLRDERAAASAEIGDTIPMLSADETTTDESGQFTVRVDADEVATNYFVGGQDRSLMNYELQVVTPSVWSSWSNTMYENDGVWRSDARAVAADQPVAYEIDLGTKRLTITDSFGESSRHDALVMKTHTH